MKKEIILDGNNFSSLAEFYDEIQNKLTKDLDWEIGRNLDAYNDVLRGGFGVYEYEEPFIFLWKNSGKSKKDLGYAETIKYLEKKLKTCHPTNISFVKNDLEEAKKGNGKTLFEIIIDITHEHTHIELKIE
jgi:RNAse (barnase) inhibitor barstar